MTNERALARVRLRYDRGGMRTKALVFALASSACAFDASGDGGEGDEDIGSVESSAGPPLETSDGATLDAGSLDGADTSTGDDSSGASDPSTDPDGGPLDTTSTSSSTSVADDDAEGGSSSESSTGEPVVPWCDVNASELAACYDFADLDTGVLVDGSATGNDGTVAGITMDTGPLGDAAVFSADSQISVPADAATDFGAAATLELFVRVDALPGGSRAGILDRDGQWSIFVMNDGNLRCGASSFAYSSAFELGEWMHVGCVFTQDDVDLYVNGELVAEAGGGAIATGDGDPLAIGDNSPSFDEPLDGAIGGVRLWSTVRSAEELCEGAGELCR